MHNITPNPCAASPQISATLEAGIAIEGERKAGSCAGKEKKLSSGRISVAYKRQSPDVVRLAKKEDDVILSNSLQHS